MTTHEHLNKFKNEFHLVCTNNIRYKPNWMQLKFREEFRPAVFLVVIDHKNENARRALGALISHLWTSCENWTIFTERPQ